ncbi:LOW QUALITY PROTEIN: uncharacterized protein EMH_0096330 [Eimeria mitis]|uniref:Uncharacterized protein n=1 Tax=Eimeria mitis TaxID=44415 RepID=U6KKJ8_9EIME|nr:LOW QUALITY PROTEIN: uncharacterized protein EMH_0096330 [Eimeria mitis]CDJ36802.1 hypothetical protein EMH_0096330 [Eimeria mitis]
MALSLVSYYFAAAASADLHATRLLQHALPPPWLQQQHLLHRQVSHYLQLRRQEQQQQQEDLLQVDSSASTTMNAANSPQQQQQQQQQPARRGSLTLGWEGWNEEVAGAASAGSAAASAAAVPHLQQQQQWMLQQQQSRPQQHHPFPPSGPHRIAPVQQQQARRGSLTSGWEGWNEGVVGRRPYPADAAAAGGAEQQQQQQQQLQELQRFNRAMSLSTESISAAATAVYRSNSSVAFSSFVGAADILVGPTIAAATSWRSPLSSAQQISLSARQLLQQHLVLLLLL